MQELAQKQMAILRQAAEFVRSEGTLVYSTCSIEPMENDELTTEFGRKCQGWVFNGDEEYLPSVSGDPGGWHDGGYMAKWEKKGTK